MMIDHAPPSFLFSDPCRPTPSHSQALLPSHPIPIFLLLLCVVSGVLNNRLSLLHFSSRMMVFLSAHRTENGARSCLVCAPVFSSVCVAVFFFVLLFAPPDQVQNLTCFENCHTFSEYVWACVHDISARTLCCFECVVSLSCIHSVVLFSL